MDNSVVQTWAISPSLFWLCVLTAVLGLLVIGAIVWFGRAIFLRADLEFFNLARFVEFWQQANLRPNLPRYFVDAHSEALQRRNEFWTTYGQVVIATLVIVILAILLLTKTISAEAGLPLLSAVSGFAIAKSVGANRAGSSGADRE